MEQFSWKKDFKKVQWKETALLILVRGVAAGLVWTVFIAFNAHESFLELLKIFGMWTGVLCLLPIVAMLISAVAQAIPFIGLLNLPIILLLLAADPFLFLLNKIAPRTVPVESYPFFNFKALTFVMEPDLSTLSKEELTSELLELGRCAAVLDEQSIEYAKKLLQNGADPNAEDEGYAPPIIYAAGSNAKLLQILIDYGADVNTVDSLNSIPIVAAIVEDCPVENLKILVRHGVDVNAISDNDSTPLMIAAYRAYFDKVKFLVENGARVNDLNPDHQTALDSAYLAVEDQKNHCDLDERFDREIIQIIEFLKSEGGCRGTELSENRKVGIRKIRSNQSETDETYV